MENNNRGAALKVLNDIRAASAQFDLINKGDHIVIGLSGGPDSVCLFFALYTLKDELDITLSAVHINHKFRPGAAEADQEYVEKLCDRLNVRRTSIVRDCNIVAREYGITSEEAGRRVRYEAFDEEAEHIERTMGKSRDRIKIAVAHNAEDQAETLLFRLIRGTGTDGLAGIERKRLSEKGYTIIRPLLSINRSDIEAFCEENNLEPRIDHTNLEPIYSRNKIRLGLIPYISENFNENITEALNRLAAIAGEDRDYLWQKAEEAYAKAKVPTPHPPQAVPLPLKGKAMTPSPQGEGRAEIVLSLEALKLEHKAIRHRVIMRAFDEIGLGRDIGAVHLEAADSVIERGSTGKTVEFPYGYSMVTRYGEVAFRTPHPSATLTPSPQGEGCDFEAEAAVPSLSTKVVSVHEWNSYIISRRNAPKDYAGFDYGKLCEEKGINPACDGECSEAENLTIMPILRTKQPGDYISLAPGRKKIQDFLVDNKVPRDLRDKVLMAAIGNEILWIVGADSGLPDTVIERGRYSSKYSVSDTTKQVLILELAQKIW